MKITPARLQQCIDDLDYTQSYLSMFSDHSPDVTRRFESLRLASTILAALPGDVEVTP